MYPDSFLQWLGYTAILFGVLGLIAMLAFYVDYRYKRWEQKRGQADDTQGSDPSDGGGTAGPVRDTEEEGHANS